ncbi:MAG TPA: hypothetical protein VEQ85_08505, partial [Lacipirellulaceae bacterium]|nr:hypothetical protein [Lacipirellulaceae bacterium]
MILSGTPGRRRRCGQPWRGAASLALGLVLAGGRGTACAADALRPLRATGALAKQLEGRVTLAWDGQGIGAALDRLAQVQRLPLWIDRRVDRNWPVTVNARDLAARDVLDAAAAGAGDAWGWSTLETVVYFGPRESARDLATLAELAREGLVRAPAEARRAWLTPSPWEFPRLAEPGALLAQAVEAAGAELAPGAAVPHDLWQAHALPRISPLDRALLVLIGFDLTVAPSADGKRARVAPLPPEIAIQRDYPRSAAVSAMLQRIAAEDPAARVRQVGARAELSGRWEDHARVRLAQRGGGAAPTAEAPARRRPAQGGRGSAAMRQRFTLTIANKPVGAVVSQLEAQVGLSVTWDAAVAARPGVRETLVSCEVRDADLDELLRAILDPAGLAFDRDGMQITIRGAR